MGIFLSFILGVVTALAIIAIALVISEAFDF
jgi:hypothetical protein